MILSRFYRAWEGEVYALMSLKFLAVPSYLLHHFRHASLPEKSSLVLRFTKGFPSICLSPL